MPSRPSLLRTGKLDRLEQRRCERGIADTFYPRRCSGRARLLPASTPWPMIGVCTDAGLLVGGGRCRRAGHGSPTLWRDPRGGRSPQFPPPRPALRSYAADTSGSSSSGTYTPPSQRSSSLPA